MISKKLIDARTYEQEKIKEVDEALKPVFHAAVPVGWMNDPNGFSVFNQECHLFYQYHPYSTEWGPMHWGHFKTKDFVKWERLPIALAPDTDYDFAGCFSGSALEYKGEHVLVYTGVIEEQDDTGKKKVLQVQCIASGDGKEYKKWDCNPIISAKSLPEGVYEEDFRDPKIWKYENTFYLVVASRSEDKSGQIALYKSECLREWQFVKILARSNNQYGNMWECPDFFELQDKYILITSPQDMMAKGMEFHNGNNAVYISGEFDYETYEFTQECVKSIDYGLDFYAPQTLENEDGRRIMIAWMQSWDTKINQGYLKWNGMMTFPRELELNGNKLVQKPVKEIENYYSDNVEYQKYVLSGTMQLEGISGRELDIQIDIIKGEYQEFEIQLAHNNTYTTKCSYIPKDGMFTFDRTYSGLNRDVPCIRTMIIPDKSVNITIRILLDKYSAEIFINDGKQVMSNVIYTPLEAQDILFNVNGELVANIVKHKISV
jgi:beta-fructofuranosidase